MLKISSMYMIVVERQKPNKKKMFPEGLKGMELVKSNKDDYVVSYSCE